MLLRRCFALLAAVFLIFLTGCRTHYETQDFPVVILDDGKLLSANATQSLQAFRYPQGFPFVIRTIKELPPAEIGSLADRMFGEDAKRTPVPDACTARCVYILVSRQPSIVQVRVGSEIANQARWAGLTAGPDYIAKQSLAPGSSEPTPMLEWLATSLPPATQTSWWQWLTVNSLSAELYWELDHLSLPSDNFYGKFILRPFLEARVLEDHFAGTWWMSYIFASFVALGVGFIITRTINMAIGETNPQVANGMTMVAKILLKLAIAVPAATSMILLSGSRMEDQIALQASGISGIERFSFNPGSYEVATGIFLAIALAIVRIVKGVAHGGDSIMTALLPQEKQKAVFAQLREKNPAAAWLMKSYTTTEIGEIDIAPSEDDFEEEPYSTFAAKCMIQETKTGLKWGLAGWLFLPRALSVVAICIWVAPILKDGVKTLLAWISLAPLRK